MSPAGMAGDGDRTRLVSALWELTSRVRFPRSLLQAHSVLSAKVRSAREAARLAAGREVVSGIEKSGSSSSFTSEKRAERGKPWEEEGWKKIVRHGMERYNMMRARKLGAVRRTLPCVLPEECKVHSTLIAQTELVLAKLTAVRTFQWR